VICCFDVSTFIDKLDENSHRRWRYEYLSTPQVVLTGSFLNEAFICERMILASDSVPYHAILEVVAGIWLVLFLQTVVTSECKKGKTV
jgi:hypothetical protein